MKGGEWVGGSSGPPLHTSGAQLHIATAPWACGHLHHTVRVLTEWAERSQ